MFNRALPPKSYHRAGTYENFAFYRIGGNPLRRGSAGLVGAAGDADCRDDHPGSLTSAVAVTVTVTVSPLPPPPPLSSGRLYPSRERAFYQPATLTSSSTDDSLLMPRMYIIRGDELTISFDVNNNKHFSLSVTTPGALLNSVQASRLMDARVIKLVWLAPRG